MKAFSCLFFLNSFSIKLDSEGLAFAYFFFTIQFTIVIMLSRDLVTKYNITLSEYF